MARIELKSHSRTRPVSACISRLLRNPQDALSLHLMARMYLDGGEDAELAEALAGRAWLCGPSAVRRGWNWHGRWKRRDGSAKRRKSASGLLACSPGEEVRRSVREGGFLKKPPSLTLHSAKLFSEHFAVEMLLESSGARLPPRRPFFRLAAIHLRRTSPVEA